MSLALSGISNQVLPPTFHESANEADDEFVAVNTQASFLQKEAQTQESFDGLVRLVDDIGREFIKKIEGCSYQTTKEPEELSAQLGEILDKIHCYSLGLKKIEEAQGPWQFWRSRFGLGGDHPSQILLKQLDAALKASFRGYLKRCQVSADRVLIEGQFSAALKVYRRLETIAPRNGGILERLGDLYMQAGQREKAIDYFDKLLSRKIRPVSCSFKKAHCLLDLGRSKEAFEILHRLSQKNAEIVAIKKELILKGIESKIKLGRYLDAISDAHLAIENYPEVDEFKRNLIDAYLAYSIRDNGELFRKHFPQLSSYFSKQSCYSVVRRSSGDSLQVMFDLFDYSAKRSSFAFTLYQECICSAENSLEFLEICYDNLLSRLEFLEMKKESVQREKVELYEKIKTHSFEDEDETAALRTRLVALPEEFVGGRLAPVKIGLIQYINFYNAVILRLKDKVKQADWKQKIEQLDARAKLLKNGLVGLVCEFLNELRGLFTTREQIAKRAKNIQEPDDEISAVDLIKRGNLMNFIKDAFVPKEEQEEMVKYLEMQGIDLDSLFHSELMSAACGTKVLKVAEMKALQDFVKAKTIKTIDDLKRYNTK